MNPDSATDRSLCQGSLPPLESPSLVSASTRVSYGRPSSQCERNQIFKLQEKIKTFQEEIQRKDRVIEEMSRLELKPCPDKFLESSRSSSRAFCNDKEEVAALHVKLDNLKKELSDTSCELYRKDAAVDTLKRLNGQLKEEVARLKVTADTNSKVSEEYNEAKEAFETIRKRNDMLINSLQKQLTDSQNQLLQSKIEINQLENDVTEIRVIKEELQEQIEVLTKAISVVTSEEIQTMEEVVEKIKTLIYEKECADNKVLSVEEKLKSRDCEQQASRQTISRLVSKLSAEEVKNSVGEENLVVLKKELEQSKVLKSMMDSETESFQCQIQSLSKELEVLRQDNDIKTRRIQELSGGPKSSKHNDGHNQLLNQFIEEVVEILSQTYKKPSDQSYSALDWILGCIKSLQQTKEETMNLQDTVDSLKSEVIEMEKLNSESSDRGNIQTQVAFDDLKARFAEAQKELTNASLIIDQLNCDKVKYFRILSELAQVMNICGINKDVGFDMISEALYGRATQLQKLEFEAQADHRINEHSLQRKLKEMKERANSKDLHIDLLHKKLAALEGRQFDKVTVEKERDKELACSKRLVKNNQRQQEEIESLREEVVVLKTKLIDFNKAQSRVLILEQEVTHLNAKIEKLELMRQKQLKVTTESKNSQSNKDKEFSEFKISSEVAINSLQHELNIVKASLEDSKRKEHQMLELRAVISRLLGLDLDTMAIPDFEIVNRLERLITAHQSNVYTAYSMNSALKDMNQGFYHDPCMLVNNHTYITDERPIYPKVNDNKISPSHYCLD